MMVRRAPSSGLLPGLGGQHRAFFCFKTAKQKNCPFLTKERRENSPESTQRTPIHPTNIYESMHARRQVSCFREAGLGVVVG